MLQTHFKPFSTGDFPELEALRTLIQRAGGQLRSEGVYEVRAGCPKRPWPAATAPSRSTASRG